MEAVVTTPFEDLVLGSQFLPLLAQTGNSDQEDKSSKAQNIGIFQCRQCGATFLQVKEALTHYKFHVFESHKNYFSVVVGGLCPQPGCTFASEKKQGIHFHCTYCSFSACEILDLPLHMEKGHLAFYKEVSLVLRGENVQLNKVFQCGECNLQIQGTVSIVQHLLSHESENSPCKMNEVSPSMPNGSLASSPASPLLNGNSHEGDEIVTKMKSEKVLQEESSAKLDAEEKCADEVAATKDEVTSKESINEPVNTSTNELPSKASSAIKSTPEPSSTSAQNVNARALLPLLQYMKENQDSLQVEINPLDLLSSLMEEDQKSDCPLFPTQHFLLGMPNSQSHPNQGGDNNIDIDEADSSFNDLPPITSRTREDEPSPESLLNGFAEYVEQSSGVFQCNQCNDAFKYQYLLAAHRKKVHQGQVLTPFKCHICGNEFAVIGDLKRHMYGHSRDFTHFCQVCGHAFTDPVALKSHLTEHSKTSSSRSSGSREAYGLSTPDKPLRCESCSEEFPSKSELTRHIVKFQGTCNPNKAESLKCATCSVQLASLEDLKEHRRTAHPISNAKLGPGKKGFQCDYCGKTFSCRSNLRDHLVVHTGEKPYPCDICGKAFSFIHNMKTHRLTHNKGRNEVCPYCDKAYKSKISLYYHMKKGNCRGLSTKEVPEGFHRCTECLQMFASEDRYQVHKLRGHCQMSYRCMHCGIRCSSQEKLDKHLKKGMCTKPQTNSVRPKTRQKRSSSSHNERHDRPSSKQEDPCCDRCNYTRDCCCTFSCQLCGKRIFSILAYTTHRRRTCPALRQRKERIRAAIMEKRKKEELELQKSAEKLLDAKASPESGHNNEEGEEEEEEDFGSKENGLSKEPFLALRTSLALQSSQRKIRSANLHKMKVEEDSMMDLEESDEAVVQNGTKSSVIELKGSHKNGEALLEEGCNGMTST